MHPIANFEPACPTVEWSWMQSQSELKGEIVEKPYFISFDSSIQQLTLEDYMLLNWN